jgi:O-antigen ligase
VRRPGRITEGLFFATLFSVTFEKIHWEVAGTVGIADIVTLLFLTAFAGERLVRYDRWFPATVLVLLAFLAAFLIVYLLGFFNLETQQALAQFGKGMVKFVIHFAFLIAGVSYLARRSDGFYWKSLAWLCAGLAVNAVYGMIQLIAAEAGYDLDAAIVSPLTGGASSINVFGAVEGEQVYRPNALTGDPNHLGVMLLVPLLVLTPIYLRLERGHRLRLPLAALLAFLLVVEVATLSRSGALGLVAGLLVLALPYRRKLLSRAALVPLAAVAAVLAYAVTRRTDFFETVFRARVSTGGASSSAHFDVYGFVPDVLQAHPLFGLGLNNFSVYYELVTGEDNWGPHSFYVALLVETGLVGTALFALFLLYLFRRLSAGRQLGRLLAAARDPAAARVRPLAWGLTAALVGTMAANAFYLTMQFYYFYAFAVMAVAVPVVFRRPLLRP